MKGVFEERPQLRRSVTWDVNIVLEFFKNKAPAQRLSLKELTLKTVILLSLVLGQRNQGLHMMDVRNMDIKFGSLKIRWGDVMKGTTSKFHQEEVHIKAYKDKRLCPVWYTRKYLERTNDVRKKYNMFLITQKPFRPAAKGTIAKWIRMALQEAGINMSIFTPHSTRAAATSAMEKAKIPISTIMATAGWGSSRTFAKYYKKTIVSKQLTVASYM
jgi:integrase